MNERKKIFVPLLWIILALLIFPEFVYAKLDWKIVNQIDLNAPPIDVAISEDGGLIFVLTLGEIVVYSSSLNSDFRTGF